MSGRDAVDPDLVHRIVVEGGRIFNPYKDIDGLVEILNTLKSYRIRVARSGKLTTYRETADNAGIFTARQSYVLVILGIHEDEIGNPPLSADVVQSRDPPMVGEKYFDMVEKCPGLTDDIPVSEAGREKLWRNHLREAQKHWSEKDE